MARGTPITGTPGDTSPRPGGVSSAAASPAGGDREAARLGELEYLDAVRPEADGTLQDLVDEVRRIFGTALCMVNLVTADSQFFRAWSGELPPGLVGARQDARARSMCTHVVEAEAPLVVRDFLADERFREQHFCITHGIRFYAGAPLVTSSGHAIGSLCLLDTRPREFGPDRLTLLETFARAVVGRLELLGALAREQAASRAREELYESLHAATQKDARRTATRLSRTLKLSPDLICTVGLSDGIIRAMNPASAAILGYEPGELIGSYVMDLVHADDRESTAVAAAGGTPIIEFRNRYIRKDGRVVWLEWRAVPVLEEDACYCVARDITDRERAEEALLESEGRFRALFERSPDGVLLFDPHAPEAFWRIVDCNEAAARMNGYEREELIGQSINLLVGDGCGPQEWAEYLDELREGAVHGHDVHRRKDGTTVPIDYSSSIVTVGGRELVLGIDRDVSERIRTEDELRRSRESLANTQRIAHLGSWVWDMLSDELSWSDEVYRIFGLTPQEFGATNDAFLERVHPDDRARVTAAVAEAAREGERFSIDHRIIRPDGELRHVHEEAEIVCDAAGTPLRMVGAVHDVTDRRALEERLRHQASHDPLTDLPNRVLLRDRLEHALARADRDGLRVAVLFLDLDGFKHVNDSLGHEVGDQLLIATAGRLRGCLRPGDTVARLGGDEFAVLIETIAHPGYPVGVAERIAEQLEAPFSVGGHELFVGASIGIALARCGADAIDLLREADIAMYRAKRGGRAPDGGGCRYEVFDPRMGLRALERADLEADLRRAIERCQLEVFYQPLIELSTGRVRGMEALARWRHPDRGLIGPAEFIPLAEETGLILSIGNWVLDRACRDARAWRDSHGEDAPTVSVNLSARQLEQTGLVGEVERALRASGLEPGRLTLEITESMLMGDADSHIAALRRLKSLGVLLAIDDFGTGYSSLAYLQRFPMDTLKIDKSFVDGLGQGRQGRAIVEAVIRLAHGLDESVVAEGVETGEQAACLETLGCNLGQGYYFARPMEAAAVADLLAKSARPHHSGRDAPSMPPDASRR